MHIKRFTGTSVKEALKAVKAEFGDQALILSTKRLAPGVHEVVAAVDYDLSEPVNVELKPKEAGTPVPPAKGGASSGGRGAATGSDGRSAQELSGEIKRELKELKELKELCMTFVSRSEGPLSEVFNRLEENLVKNGIDKRLARKILMNTLSGVTKDKAADIVYLKGCMKKRMYERISVKDPLSERGVVAFVGPSGVGKTTTIAKLAAINSLKKKRKVALLTMDTYRIAAAEQLKVYGKLIGVPVEVAKDLKELASFLAVHRDKDLVLIDTAGRNQRNKPQMDELKGMAAAHPSVRFNLVLSSQTRDEAIYDSVKGFGALPIDSLTFTKLDEGPVHGTILNAMVLARKPVAYLSTGSRVPEDIEAASRERLVNIFMPN